MIGFETIGNATLICHDGRPVLTTDPWISGRAYFGSWGLTHEIPKEQLENILGSEYIWCSHGHPDHMDAESLDQLAGRKILLPDHVGGRIYNDLAERGYDVSILPDRKWVELSEHIKVLCISDYFQDAILLVDINGRLIVNLNDAADRGWGRFVRRTIKEYDTTFLLKLFCYGDPDMNNFFSEEGERITPLRKFALGERIQFWAELYGVKYVVPFSSSHRYQRRDSAWANEYVSTFEEYRNGLTSERFELLPGFIRFDCTNDTFTEIDPAELESVLHDPAEFGDDWSEVLEPEDVEALEDYLQPIEHLGDHLDFIRFAVGGREHTVALGKRPFTRGISFEVPRSSLMTAVKYQVFDDLLIGNFMKTTLHGMPIRDFLPDFTQFTSKYADNGRARSKQELRAYFRAYRKRSGIEYLLHAFERESERRFRGFVNRDSALFEWAKKGYLLVKA